MTPNTDSDTETPDVGAEVDNDVFVPTPKVDQPPLTLDCRPVDHLWDPATEPMLLPCEPTKEPCDEVDNDADGFTDPHCGSMSCTSDGACTYGGLLPDADCNIHSTPSNTLGDLPGGVGNQIDGVPGVASLEECWGMLCPPALKCVQGECLQPGTGLPGQSCTSGADCPLNSGCIPIDDQTVGESVGECVTYCQDFPCPDGFLCLTSTQPIVGSDEEHTSMTCHEVAAGQCTSDADIDIISNNPVISMAFECGEGFFGSEDQIAQCIENKLSISPGCTACWAELVSCAFTTCASDCVEFNETCFQCIDLYCLATFEACSGILD